MPTPNDYRIIHTLRGTAAEKAALVQMASERQVSVGALVRAALGFRERPRNKLGPCEHDTTPKGGGHEPDPRD